jgi:hypothetical protein
MKVIQFEGSREEFQAVAHLFEGSPAPEQASDRGTGEAEQPTLDPVTAIRRMIARREVPYGQHVIYRALADGRQEYDEFLRRAERDARRMSGTLGALGRRINETPEIHQAGLPGDTSAVLKYETEGEIRYISLTPEALEALRAEGII